MSSIRPTLGKYELVERLAAGGMGEIFLARERGLHGFDRLVVVKQLLPELADRPEMVALFINEARIWAHLSHPNIVQLLEFGEDRGSYFLAMEHVPGQNVSRLTTRLANQREGRTQTLGDTKMLPRVAAIHIVLQVARALDFAHRAEDSEKKALGIVHRDVSPHNVLVSFHGDVKLTDFGIARAANQLRGMQTRIRGKPAYMAPEQLSGHTVDARADVFSCGVMLWELTLGRRLFAGAEELGDQADGTSRIVVAPSAIDPAYPGSLEEIVMAALSSDPTQRLPSASELVAGLRGYLAGNSLAADTDALGRVVRELFHEESERTRALEQTLSRDMTASRGATAEAEWPAAYRRASSSALPASAPATSRFRQGVLFSLLAMVVVLSVLLGRVYFKKSTPIPRTTITAGAPAPAVPASVQQTVEPVEPATREEKPRATEAKPQRHPQPQRKKKSARPRVLDQPLDP